jgi:hypothetical protein
VSSRFVSNTRCFLSLEKQHDYPRSVKLGSVRCENEPQHTPLGVSFRGKKKDFAQKRWNSREKEGMGGVCAASFWQVHV